jgi:hypothetical protein
MRRYNLSLDFCVTHHFAIVFVLLATLFISHTTTVQAQPLGIVKPLGQASQQRSLQPESVNTGNGIEYHGGPVMAGPHNVYFIWYGNWSGDTATTILPDLIFGLNNSNYFNTNTTYGDNSNDIANSITLAGQFFDNYSQGASLGTTGVKASLTAALNANSLPADPNGIYLVLTSPDVTEGSFCTQYCGYHTRATIKSTDIKFGFIGNPATQCPSGCSAQSTTPNGNLGADAMANVIAHEINETVTDPDLNAWFHNNLGGEVGDLCNFKFGNFFLAPNGAAANINLPTTNNVTTRNFLIQENWVNDSGGFCGMGFNPASRASLNFVPVPPCRMVDTRNPVSAFGGPSLIGGVVRGFTVPASNCNIPFQAQAYSINATVVPKGPLGFLTMFSGGQPLPLVSTLNSTDGRVKAAAAIVPAGVLGGLAVFASNNTDLILDINGYFVPSTTPSSLAFFPLTPCRLVDTRGPTGALGGPSLVAGTARSLPILSSTCNVPATAQAYSLNFTSVPRPSGLGFLTTWPTGTTQPVVSTLNAPTGVVTANAAIVPAGTGGAISVFASNDSDLVIDINGYFAPPAAGGLSFHSLTPCRVLDSRVLGIPPQSGQADIPVGDQGCSAPPVSQAYVLNATVIPAGGLGFLTLWPQGLTQPLVSTLNAGDGAITSNLAIVPTNNAQISAFGSNPTHLVLDISGYFAP